MAQRVSDDGDYSETMRRQALSRVLGDDDAPNTPRVPGNIDLAVRPRVANADGTTSTIRSISIGTDAGEVLIPTVIDGHVVSNDEAIRHYRSTGEHLGIFTSPDEATAYAQWLHRREASGRGSRATR